MSEPHEGGTRRPKLAAVTMVRDESVMLPRWVDHYTKQCGSPEALVVIDDNSRDGSTEDLPCSVIRIPEETKKRAFERSRMTMVSGIAAGLLAVYDAVVFSDADEFLVADPARYETLTDLVWDRPKVPVLGAMALNVIHHVGVEDDLDPDRPILAQRRLVKFIPRMCKPAVKRTPAAWTASSHGVKAPYAIDPDLYLFHAKFSDRKTLHGTAEQRRWIAETYGRARASTWQHSGDKMVRLLERVAQDVPVDGLEPFAPPTAEVLESIVGRPRDDEVHRALGLKQFQATRKKPFVLVPERFQHSV